MGSGMMGFINPSFPPLPINTQKHTKAERSEHCQGNRQRRGKGGSELMTGGNTELFLAVQVHFLIMF